MYGKWTDYLARYFLFCSVTFTDSESDPDDIINLFISSSLMVQAKQARVFLRDIFS